MQQIDLNYPIAVMPFFQSTACADFIHGSFTVVMIDSVYLFWIRILRVLIKIYSSSS